MFNIGDKVVYGKTGVCTVENKCEKEIIKNEKRLYYVLKPQSNPNSTIFAPVDSQKVFIRHVMTKDEAEKLILEIPDISGRAADIELSREQYETMIATHNCEDLVGLTYRLYTKRMSDIENRKKPGFVDEKYLLLAEKLLFGELSAAIGIPFDEVKDYIGEKLNNK